MKSRAIRFDALRLPAQAVGKRNSSCGARRAKSPTKSHQVRFRMGIGLDTVSEEVFRRASHRQPQTEAGLGRYLLLAVLDYVLAKIDVVVAAAYPFDRRRIAGRREQMGGVNGL